MKKYDTPWARPSMAISVALKDAIRERRGSMGTREAAKEAEVSSATLNRVERGYMPDIVTFAKLCIWLDRSPSEFLFQQHSDDAAVDRFSNAMKSKLARKRADGYGGWDDPDICTVQFLRDRLVEHTEKADMIDVANFAMMIWFRTRAERLGERLNQNETRPMLLSRLMNPNEPDDAI